MLQEIQILSFIKNYFLVKCNLLSYVIFMYSNITDHKYC